MMKYTVVLNRSERLCDPGEFGKDSYSAYVETDKGLKHAVWMAKVQVLRSDRKDKGTKDWDVPLSEADYLLSVVFEGRPKPVMWGWQE